MRRPRLLIAAMTFIVTGMAFAVPSFAATAGTASAPVIVGLGDSFTSGVGSADLDASSGICRRSPNSYPLLAAKQLGVTGANAACSGAPVSALTETFRGQQPQISKIGSAKFVVMTVGGNDVLSLSNATNLLIDQAKFEAQIAAVRDQLVTNLKAAQAQAPSAQFMLLAYPDLFPSSNDPSVANCPTGVSGVLTPLHTAFTDLNSAIQSAATTGAVSYVGTSNAFKGHDICSTDPWVASLTDPNTALHPNDKGYAALAKAAASAIKPLMTDALSTTKASPGEATTTGLVAPPVEITPATEAPVVKVAPRTEAPVVKVIPKAAPSENPPSSKTEVLGETATPVATEPAPTTSSTPSVTGVTATQLAHTGYRTSFGMMFGSLLMAIGFGLIWLKLRLEAQDFTAA